MIVHLRTVPCHLFCSTSLLVLLLGSLASLHVVISALAMSHLVELMIIQQANGVLRYTYVLWDGHLEQNCFKLSDLRGCGILRKACLVIVKDTGGCTWKITPGTYQVRDVYHGGEGVVGE